MGNNITIGGLASGLDSGAIIDKLMAIERQPNDRLTAQKTTAGAKLAAVKKFNSALETLMTKAGTLSSATTLRSQAVAASSTSFLSASASSSAAAGTYEVKVGRLAQVEKSVYAGVADKATTTFGTGTLVLNNDALGTPVNITIDSTNNTLEGIRDAINTGTSDHGVSASIVNDGSGMPYRLVLTGKAVANANISLNAAGLTGGTGAFPVKDAAVSRSAQTALVQVDGISITSNTNTLTEAIPGLTINLSHADLAFTPLVPNWSAVTSTTLTVNTDSSAMQTKVQDFVTAFNAVVSAAGDAAISGDSGIRAILGNLRGKLTSSTSGTGLFQLGITSQKDGTLAVDSAKLADAIGKNLSGVESLLAGTSTTDGIADQLKSSLSSFTNATAGFLAGRQKSYDSAIHNIDTEIARNEVRLASMEKQLTAQFAALENLVSSLNTQGSYLTQQMNANNGGNN